MTAPVISGATHRILLKGEFEPVLKRTIDALRAAGFNIAAQIDMRDILSKRQDINLRQYRILSLLNPDLAHRALTIAPEAGLALLCSVVVSQGPDNLVDVWFIDPVATLGLLARPYLRPVADELHARLDQVTEALKS